MANFMGGSAVAMAGQISEGFILLSPATLKGYNAGDLTSLRVELERLQREARSVVPPQDDAPANQVRNRKITRLNSAIQVVNQKMQMR